MQIRENFSLKPYNTFGIEAAARYFAVFQTIEDLDELLQMPIIAGQDRKLILGGGSNILLTRDLDAVVLRNEMMGRSVIKEDEEYAYIRSGAGENWHGLVQYSIELGYGGMENLSLIPGNVGASPMQNIGAYGVEVKDIFDSLEAYHIGDRKLQTFSLEDCAFGYRESVFKNKFRDQFVITSVTYKLRKRPQFQISYGAIQQELEKMHVKDLNVRAVSQAVIRIRTSKLPDWKEVGNAGSFFKNPLVSKEKFEELHAQFPAIVAYPQGDGMKLAAGWLIEQCGWKGHRQGDAGCYPLQALVLVNYGNATGKEIFDLSEAIIKSVKDKFGVELEREVNVF